MTRASAETLAVHLEVRAADHDNDRYTARLLRETANAIRELAEDLENAGGGVR
jgi:hypothetical protein